MGAAFGTWRAAKGILATGVHSPELVMKNIIPVIMAGVLGVYGLIVSIIISGKIHMPDSDGLCKYSQHSAFAHLAAGVCVGLASLASGIALGIASDAGVRANGAQAAMAASWKKMGFSKDDGEKGGGGGANDSLFVAGVLVQVFASNIGLYSLIIALILTQVRSDVCFPYGLSSERGGDEEARRVSSQLFLSHTSFSPLSSFLCFFVSLM